MSQTSMQDDMGQPKVHGSMMSDMKSEIMPGSSHEHRNKAGGYILSALNSEIKSNHHARQQDSVQKQSFMNKLSQACPLVKDVSFGGPQSFGAVSGLPSSSTAQNKQDCNVFPTTAQSQIAFSQLMGRSVTPRPLNAVTPVTVTAHNIQTPKYVAPGSMHGVMGQDMPGTNHDGDAVSQRSQPSAFKPVTKKRMDAGESVRKDKILQPNLMMGVTKSNDKKCVTESATAGGAADVAINVGQVQIENVILSNTGNSMSPQERRNNERQINEMKVTTKEADNGL